jgi:hypothetical protein
VRRTAGVADAFQSPICWAAIKRLPGGERGKFQQNDPARLPVALVHLVGAAAREIFGIGLFQSGLHARHELLVAASLISISKITQAGMDVSLEEVDLVRAGCR